MEENIIHKRAEELDTIVASGISDLLTLEEADGITRIYGSFLERTSFLTMVFLNDIPESFLPYPKRILIGALERSRQHFISIGNTEHASVINSIMIGLVGYNNNDEEAFEKAAKNFSDQNWRKIFVKTLRETRDNELTKGFTLDEKLFILPAERMKQLMKDGN